MNMSSNINVLLVDDHQVLLDGLKLLLKDTPGIQIIGTANNGQKLLDYLKVAKQESIPVDVILMDINMPVMDGLEATHQVKLLYPKIKVIMLTMRDQMPDVKMAEVQGADGFLSKNNGKKEIVDAITKVYRKQEFVVYIDSDKPASTAPSITDSSHEEAFFLTKREKQIICLICQECDITAIAALLSLSPVTVSAQRKNILSKLGVTTDAGIVRESMARGLCDDVQLPEGVPQ